MYYGNGNDNGNWNGSWGNGERVDSPDLSNLIVNNNRGTTSNNNSILYNTNTNLTRIRSNNNYNLGTTNFSNNLSRGVMSRYNSMQIITMIDNEVTRQFKERVTGKEVTQLLERLEKDGYIKIIGKGTNRTVFEFVIDDRDLKRNIGLNVNEPMVYKVPIQVALGRVANNREALTTTILNRYLDNNSINNNDSLREALVYLINVLPFKTIIPNTNILAITKCVPIEFSTTIINLAREKNIDVTTSGVSGELRPGDADFKVKSGIGNVIRNYIVHDPTGNKMARKLLDALNKFFVVADMNPDFSPFNYGFINLDGKLFLTSLDLGAVIPRLGKVSCPHCGDDLIPVYPWDEVITQSEKNLLKTEGMFRCTNENCNHGRPSYFKDVDIVEMARQNIIDDIIQNRHNYELLDKI